MRHRIMKEFVKDAYKNALSAVGKEEMIESMKDDEGSDDEVSAIREVYRKRETNGADYRKRCLRRLLWTKRGLFRRVWES